MKNKFLLLTIIFALIIGLVACDKEQSKEEVVEVSEEVVEETKTDEEKKSINYAVMTDRKSVV